MPRDKVSIKLVAILAVSGLISGLVTSISMYPHGQEGIFSGAIFGFFLVVSLVASRMLDDPLEAATTGFLMIVVAIGADFFSYCAAFGFQLLFRGIVPTEEQWNMGTNEPASPVALVVGGFVGGLLIFCAALLLFGRGIEKETLVRKTLVGAVVGSLLGVAGWALRSSVGVAVWHFLHHFQLTPVGEDSPRWWFGNEYDYSETTRMYSLYVVWQTGVTITVGTMIRRFRLASADKR